jgi:arylsulfatase A-like enzyme
MRNVLLIVVDQWRADCMPYLGTPHLKTPNLDRLCKMGVTFSNHVTPCVPCGPARASLHTGLYLMNHRQVQNWIPLDKRHKTLPRALRELGHDPALIGYTTTPPDPTITAPADPRFCNLGDLMDGWRPVGDFGPDHDHYFGWLAQQGYELPANRDDIWLPEGMDAVPGATNRPARIPAHLSDSAFFTEKALEYLKGRDGKPFFLHLGYYRPHPPFVASAPYHAMYRPEDMPKPVRAASAQIEAQQHPLLAHYLRHSKQSSYFQRGEGLSAELTEAQLAQMRATYYGMMTEVDACIGRVLAQLDATDAWKDTLVIFTSDHGEQLGDHHLLGKLAYFDESFRIPLVIVDPDAKTTQGHVVSSPTESIDLMPTILEWLGGTAPNACDGHSLLPFLVGETPTDWRDALHYEFDFRNVYPGNPEGALGLGMNECTLMVLQDPTFKYVHFTASPPLLFDLTSDPAQLINRADDPAYGDIVRRYAQKALSWRMRHADRSLTHYRASPQGLELRDSSGNARPITARPN